MPLQLTPDEHFSAVGNAEAIVTTPDSVQPPYHPIQFRLKEHIDQESMVKSLCNHDSYAGENECEPLKLNIINLVMLSTLHKRH